MSESTTLASIRELRAIFDEAFAEPWEGKHQFRYAITAEAQKAVAKMLIDLRIGDDHWTQVMDTEISLTMSAADVASDVLSRLLADHPHWPTPTKTRLD